MAADQELPDERDEAQLAWLLTSAHDAPEMRGEFVRELKERLDVEFAAARSEYVHRNGKATHGMNGAAAKVEVAKPPVEESAKVEVAQPRMARRGRRRWVVGTAVAASLVMAVGVWADPPAFQAVFRAIVRGIDQLRGGGGQGGPVVGQVGEVAPAAPQEAVNEVKPQAAVEPAPAVDAVANSVVKARAADIPEEKPEPKTKAHAPLVEEPLWEPQAQENLSQRIDEQLAALWVAN